jgi:hypothetical protein
MLAGWVGSSRGCLVLAALLLLGVAVWAQTEDKEKVRVCVIAILATEKNDKVDRKLECIAKEVQKTEPKLTGFRLAHMSCQSVEVGSKKDFELVEEQQATVTIAPPEEKDNHYRIKLTPPKMGQITYTSTCGKFLPVMTRFRTKDDEVLIIAVRVNPCRRK